ncbi:MAG TPA: hypothetical protein PK020_16385 [Ilumatobacteraceae bacterium]|nr:hypothetical protein [Ilumatobacteraceae bacterium]HRB03449.1 hypothetical protein [Ilumatobacteraceae bacterium]
MAVDIVAAASSRVAQRSMAATSTGRMWVAVGNDGSNKIEMWYSDDSGATWTENTAAEITWTGAAGQNFALFIDADDHAHLVYDTSAPAIEYRRNKSISATSAWSAATSVDTVDLGYSLPDLVAHREGTGWKAHLLYKANTTGPGESMKYTPITITSADAITVGTKTTFASGNAVSTGGIDFHHTSTDEKAIQSSTPHLYMVWTETSNLVKFVKWSYSGGTWTAGTVRTIYYGAAAPSAQMVFDGTRVVITLMDGVNVGLYERDAADTTTTTRAGGGSTLFGYNMTYDADQNVWYIGLASTDLKGLQWIRATNTWGSLQTLDTDDPSMGVALRRYAGNTIPIAYGTTTSNKVRYDTSVNNVAPSAPTWVNTDNVGADVGAALTLDWNFVDDNPGDAQTAYTLRRQIGAGAYAYWKAGTSTWDAAVQKITSSTSAVTLASGWGADGDDDHKFAVLVYDVLDTVSVYSAELTVTPSVPSVPVITTPADAGTVASASLTAVWTCTSQATYLVELLDSAGTTVLHSSGVVTDSVSRSYVIPYALVNGTSYKVQVTCVNAEGLAATPDTNSFSVSYTLPATPTVVVTPSTSLAKITVTPTQPTPGGGQPTVASIDIFVRCAAGRNYPDGERPVGGVGIRVGAALPPSTAWVDYPSAGVAYEYMVRGWADNGTYADSAWTA